MCAHYEATTDPSKGRCLTVHLGAAVARRLAFMDRFSDVEHTDPVAAGMLQVFQSCRLAERSADQFQVLQMLLTR